jgi:hypothetical protein
LARKIMEINQGTQRSKSTGENTGKGRHIHQESNGGRKKLGHSSQPSSDTTSKYGGTGSYPGSNKESFKMNDSRSTSAGYRFKVDNNTQDAIFFDAVTLHFFGLIF